MTAADLSVLLKEGGTGGTQPLTRGRDASYRMDCVGMVCRTKTRGMVVLMHRKLLSDTCDMPRSARIAATWRPHIPVPMLECGKAIHGVRLWSRHGEGHANECGVPYLRLMFCHTVSAWSRFARISCSRRGWWGKQSAAAIAVSRCLTPLVYVKVHTNKNPPPRPKRDRCAINAVQIIDKTSGAIRCIASGETAQLPCFVSRQAPLLECQSGMTILPPPPSDKIE